MITDQERLTPKEMLLLIKSLNDGSIFTNIAIILRILLAMAVTNCCGEISFSSLRRVKNYLLSTLCHLKLAALDVLFVESNFFYLTSFEHVIERFAKTKTEKRSFI